MISSQQIKTVITNLMLPNAGSLHLYFDDETQARQESVRTGRPVFKSIHNGQRVWSVKIK
jgi:hypothetical protein